MRCPQIALVFVSVDWQRQSPTPREEGAAGSSMNFS